MLSDEEKLRYARHFLLPKVGEAGQEKLSRAAVLCIGTGGLGSAVGMYLAAAGVGRLGLVDFDIVEKSNLQRQIIHAQSFVGQKKILSATHRLAEINPFVEVVPHETRFSEENSQQIVGNYDVIVDCSDNFATRYLTNDAGFFLQKPVVYGAILQFSGQMSVFAPHLGGPCYRCHFPVSPSAEVVAANTGAGVLGALPGVIGSMQAMETLKLLLGIGESVLGRMICYDALRGRTIQVQLRRDPECPLCAENSKRLE